LIRSHVGAGQYRDDARRGARLRTVDLANVRMRVRGADDHAVQFIRDDNIGDITAVAAQQPVILDAPRRCADALRSAPGPGVYSNSSRRRSSRS
jgi:hypothetical protein